MHDEEKVVKFALFKRESSFAENSKVNTKFKFCYRFQQFVLPSSIIELFLRKKELIFFNRMEKYIK